MFRMVTVAAQCLEVFRAMRFPAFGVVHLEVLLAATDPTFEIVSQLDLELPFRHVQWFLSIGNPDCVGVDVLIWAGFSQWVVKEDPFVKTPFWAVLGRWSSLYGS